MKIIFVIAGAAAGLLLAACSSSDDGDAAAAAAGTTNAQPTEPPGGFGNGTTATTQSAAEQCPTAGATRSCCTTGTQTCTGSGEFNAWAACVDKSGAPLSCENKPPTTPTPSTDAGTPETSVSPPTTTCGAGMACKPGSIRYCDSKIAEWTLSTCTAAGQWGPCVETTAPNGPKCDPDSYSPEKCCPGLKLCCQDNPGGPFVDFGGGACAAISCK